MREALARSNNDFLLTSRPKGRGKKGKPGRLMAMVSLASQHGWAAVGVLAGTAVAAGVLANALLFQSGRHPSPLFNVPLTQERKAVAPAAAPSAVPARPAEPRSDARLAQPPAQAPAAEPVAAPAAKPARDPIGDLLRGGDAARKSAGAVETKPAAKPVPKAAAPATQQAKPDAKASAAANAKPEAKPAVTDAQKALAKLGYGVKPDGLMGPGTKRAVEAFEKAKGLPVTGQLSGKTLKALAAASGTTLH